MTAGRLARGERVPAIGFLAARFDEAYQHAVWTGAAAEAERLGLALVFFGGQRIGSPVGLEALDNVAYDLAAHCELAGLVVMSNVIGTYISDGEQRDFLGRFAGRALVTVGVGFEGIEMVGVDSSGAVAELAEHLVRAHGRRRFLFLAGPCLHHESAERLSQFLGAIASLLGKEGRVEVIFGDFLGEDARLKVGAFLDAGGRIDAIVSANDHMAIGAMAALSERGLVVPRDVSVTGFDDTEDSRFSTPTLTTLRQPASRLGELAVRSLARQLGLEAGGGVERPRVSFVQRESCGCAARPAPGDSDPGQLAARGLLAEKRAAVLGEIEASLVSSFSLEDILGEIARGSRELGVSSCWLGLFESAGGSLDWSRLFLAADERGLRILSPRGMRFRTAELVPGGLPATSKAYVCVSLRFGDDRLGYLIFTADSTDRRMYESFRDQVSGAIKGAMLMAAERDRERELERKVAVRTKELQAANARLVEEMAVRRRLEGELLEISNRIMGSIGRDIHDNLCQDIAGLGIMAAVLQGKLMRAGMVEEAEAAEAIARGAGETAGRAKGMARGLYPAELEAHGLVAAVENLVRSSSAREGLSIVLEVSEGFALRDSERALHLFRIVQEALANALRHSGARNIEVGLRMDRETVTVEVVDDGRGIPERPREGGGMGMQIMRYRASVIGGEFRVRSWEGGTSLSCRVAR
ncbi:MAG TPA: substrate-binding domain-containing protein [Rectinemataceae bacterium]|nr:substrate-binding domain-containing protein [Rectinemataceae bacterium]